MVPLYTFISFHLFIRQEHPQIVNYITAKVQVSVQNIKVNLNLDQGFAGVRVF